MDSKKEMAITMRMLVGDFNENHGPDGRFTSGMGGVDLQSALENGQQEEALHALSGIEVGGAVYSSGVAFVKTGKDKFREMTRRHGSGKERSYSTEKLADRLYEGVQSGEYDGVDVYGTKSDWSSHKGSVAFVEGE